MIGILLNSIREFKKPTLLTPLFVFFEALLECFIPFITSRLIDNLQAGNIREIYMIAPVLLVTAFLSLFFGFMGAKFGSLASTGFAKNLRQDAFNNVQNYSFSNIDKFSSASLVTRMTTDITNIQMSFSLIIRIAVRVPLIMLFSVIMAFIQGGKLAWLFVVILPTTGTLLFFVIKKAMPLFDKVFPKYDAFNESIQENISGIRVVKTYVREDYEKKKFKEKNDAIKNEFMRAERFVALNSPILQFGIYCAMILVTSLGAYTIITTFKGFDELTGNPIWGSLSTGKLQSLITYGFQMLNQLNMLSFIFVMITISVPAMKRVAEVISEKPDITNPENPIYEIKDGSIEFKNVSFKYSESAERNALENINLTINSGMTVGILGGTGSSKTTLVNLISRLYDVTDGELLVGGINVKEYDLKSLRDTVSVVLQKNVLFSGTIKENLLWGDINATDEEIE